MGRGTAGWAVVVTETQQRAMPLGFMVPFVLCAHGSLLFALSVRS